MPVYEYACKRCEQHFERFQSFSEPPVTVCPECGGPVRKVLHPVGIVFKGSGWYKTDSRPSDSASSTSSTSKDGKDSAGKDNGKTSETKSTESKPAAAQSALSSGDSKPAAASTSSNN
jgi:putative FmdB family regulatory protein